MIDHSVKQQFAQQQISHERYFTTPAPLQNWLWFVVAGNDQGYNVGFQSVFSRDKPIHFEFFPRNDSLLQLAPEDDDLERLIRFSQQYYTVEKWHDTLVFNDLRFGQEIGWYDPKQKFVFHYYLDFPKSNDLVVQRGRFEGWNKDVVQSLWENIKGH
jgi:inner membrane protein